MRTVVRAGLDLAMLARELPAVEASRLRLGPARAIADMRARARHAPRRSPRQRVWLQRWVRLADALMPDGGNCYRRVLLEMALDDSAAQETVFFGLRAGGGFRSGHAWLGPRDGRARQAYDVVLAL